MDQKEFSEHIFQFLSKSFPEFVSSITYGKDNSFDCKLKSPSGQFGMWIATYNSEITFGLESPTGETDIHTHITCDEVDDLENCFSDLEGMIEEVKTNKTIMYRNESNIYDWADYSQLIEKERKKGVIFPKLFWSDKSPIDRLTFNYSNARKSWEAWGFLINLKLKSPNDKVRDYVENNELLKHFRFLSFKDFHIELYKVLKDSRNNQDNIFKLLRDIPDNDARKNNADKRLADLNEHMDFITTMLNSRDKYFAHLDKDYENYIKGTGSVYSIYYLFQCVEQAIIALTSLEYLESHLDKIPSRDEFTLNTDDVNK